MEELKKKMVNKAADRLKTVLNQQIDREEQDKLISALDCKCCKCGAQAVAFWPVYDPDIPSYPYCRECLDKEKEELLQILFGVKK